MLSDHCSVSSCSAWSLTVGAGVRVRFAHSVNLPNLKGRTNPEKFHIFAHACYDASELDYFDLLKLSYSLC